MLSRRTSGRPFALRASRRIEQHENRLAVLLRQHQPMTADIHHAPAVDKGAVSDDGYLVARRGLDNRPDLGPAFERSKKSQFRRRERSSRRRRRRRRWCDHSLEVARRRASRGREQWAISRLRQIVQGNLRRHGCGGLAIRPGSALRPNTQSNAGSDKQPTAVWLRTVTAIERHIVDHH